MINLGTEKNPIYPEYENPQFWKEKLRTEAHPKLAVWSCSWKEREQVRESQTRAITRVLSEFPVDKEIRVLDAGCGVGEMVPMISPFVNVTYTGVDISPDFIDICHKEFPERYFEVGNIRNLRFEADSFDLAIAIGVQGSITGNIGSVVWGQITTELLRVAKVLYLLNLTIPSLCEKVTRERNPYVQH